MSCALKGGVSARSWGTGVIKRHSAVVGNVESCLSAVLQARVIDPALRQITDIKESLSSLK